MKLKQLFNEGRVKNAMMAGTYNSGGTTPPPGRYTWLFYTYNQFFHGTRTATSAEQAGTFVLRALQTRLKDPRLTKESCRAQLVTDATTIPRTSIEI